LFISSKQAISLANLNVLRVIFFFRRKSKNTVKKSKSIFRLVVAI
jgi:hypothetical protein